jgi:Transposase domain (DUF772)
MPPMPRWTRPPGAAIWSLTGRCTPFLADHRHQLFPPEAFGDLTRKGGGHPSVPAEVVASVLVLQALEGLSDREAVSALRRDIAWKVACGLRLDDGFHPTVLVSWRNRIRRSDRPRRIFEAVRQVVAATGVLSGRRRRVLDSTILADAVATQDTVTQLVAASAGSAGCSRRPVRSSLAPTTTTSRASRCVPGMTRRPPRRWCRGWSTTRWRCWRRSTTWSWVVSRPRRWRCWRWSPARMWRRASGRGAGGSPAGLPRIGCCPPSIPGAPYPQDQRGSP